MFIPLYSALRRLCRHVHRLTRRHLHLGKQSPRRALVAFIGPFVIVVVLILFYLSFSHSSFLPDALPSLLPPGPPPSATRTIPSRRRYDLNLNMTAIALARARWPRRNVAGGLVDDFWNSVKHDVVIGVKTGHEVAASRLSKLREFGWWSVGRDVPNMLVVGDADNATLGVVGLKQYGRALLARHHFENESTPTHWFENSGWRGDKDKNLPALHLLRTVFPNKKWYVLLDDDTYLFLDNFARFILQDGFNDDAIYTGKVFYIARCGGYSRDGTWRANVGRSTKGHTKRGLFAHGGSGIVVNGRAMDAMYPTVAGCMRDFSSCWAGDMQVGLCLSRVGVGVRRTGRERNGYERHFTPFRPSKALADRRYIARWKSDEEPITFHQLPDKEMQLLAMAERTAVSRGESVIYYELRNLLLRNGVIPAHSKRDRANKYFTTEFLPLHLRHAG